MYGFFLIDWVLQLFVIGLLCVIQTYMQLSKGNHLWWWRSFWIGASGGIYIAIYSCVYLVVEMDFSSFDSDMVYLVYMFLIITCYMLMSGTLGVMSSYILIEHLYKGAKG